MITLAEQLSPDRAVDLSLVVLSGLAEHRQEHDGPVGGTPVRYPDGDLTKPDP